MADTPVPVLSFNGGCPDCAERAVTLPGALPAIGDDFDWLQRDYDSFRLAMMEELAARFPERRRWTPADMEVVLVETVSVVLDQFSDMLDRVHGEAYLETARRPDSVRRHLSFIGYDPLPDSGLDYDPGDATSVAAAETALLWDWLTYPHKMAEAKLAGPRAIHTQRRMVTEQDYVDQLERHPLVARAQARLRWTGSWTTLTLTVLCLDNVRLDQSMDDVHGPGTEETAQLRAEIDDLHQRAGIDLINWPAAPTLRAVLREFLDAYRMAGQEVWLKDPVPVPIAIDISVLAGGAFYRSEVKRAVEQALGPGHGGFFAPAALSFGQDLHASDLISAVMALDGVETVCLNRFKRMGDRYVDQSDSGRIRLDGDEIALCDNDPQDPGRGTLFVRISGGLAG